MSNLAEKAMELHAEALEMGPQEEIPVRADFIIRMGLKVVTNAAGDSQDYEVQSASLPTTNRAAEEWEAIRVIDAKGVHHIFRRERRSIEEEV